MIKFKPGDLVERRIDNKFFYEQMETNPEYGIVLTTEERGAKEFSPTSKRQWVKVLWVGNEPRCNWHVVSSRLLKV